MNRNIRHRDENLPRTEKEGPEIEETEEKDEAATTAAAAEEKEVQRANDSPK